jgi:hypothetical protein
MNLASTPGALNFSRKSQKNGEVTTYEFHVQVTNFLAEGDRIEIVMPDPIFFSEDSQCIGISSNLWSALPCEISRD